MDALIHRLREKLQKHPNNDALRQALSACTMYRRGSNDIAERSVESAVSRLREEGLWDDDDKSIWDNWRKSLTKEDVSALNGYNAGSSRQVFFRQTFVQSQTDPPITARANPTSPRLPFSFNTPTALPMELYGLLDQAYHLHMLATDPQAVIPPGKSLLSVLSRPHAERHPPSVLHERVGDMVHRAFWDEVSARHYYRSIFD